ETEYQSGIFFIALIHIGIVFLSRGRGFGDRRRGARQRCRARRAAGLAARLAAGTAGAGATAADGLGELERAWLQHQRKGDSRRGRLPGQQRPEKCRICLCERR
ncbi:hypothetical protein MJS38_00205, partial [Burkholderia gladioli]